VIESPKDKRWNQELYFWTHSFLVKIIQNNTTSSPQRPIGNKLTRVDDEVISKIRHRDYLGSLRRLRWSDDDMRNRERIFKNQKNKVTALIRAKKRNFVISLVQMAIGNPEKMWTILKFIFQNSFSACNDDLPNELTDETWQTVTDPLLTMDLLNEYFATIAENLKKNLLHENFNQATTLTMTYDSDRSILMYPTTTTEIKSIIDSLMRMMQRRVWMISQAKWSRSYPMIFPRSLWEQSTL
jgi:hypothetical protein